VTACVRSDQRGVGRIFLSVDFDIGSASTVAFGLGVDQALLVVTYHGTKEAERIRDKANA